MLQEKMHQALNDQINAELHSSYLYLSMASWFDSKNLKGMAQWMHAQVAEENRHGMKFFHYIQERRQKVELTAIEAPKTTWTSPLEAFEDAFRHEEYITDRIAKLMDLAKELGDHATQEFLLWFVKEQVEEEASVDDIVQKLRMIGDSKNGLYIIDKELGQRGH